ncbi:hypothetical protein ACFX2F_046546 [Malus domestica]
MLFCFMREKVNSPSSSQAIDLGRPRLFLELEPGDLRLVRGVGVLSRRFNGAWCESPTAESSSFFLGKLNPFSGGVGEGKQTND